MIVKPLILIAAGALATGVALAESNPYAKSDESWISLSGTVENVSADRFTLDYGDGSIVVETDHRDRVSVIGKMDEQFFGGRELVADSLIVLKSSGKGGASADKDKKG